MYHTGFNVSSSTILSLKLDGKLMCALPRFALPMITTMFVEEHNVGDDIR